MNPEQRAHLVELLQSGREIPADYRNVLFPPDRREYELVYADKEREEDILAGAMAVPLQPVSLFGSAEAQWHNKLIFGDNLQAMSTLLRMKHAGELLNADGVPGVQLIYIDPPFATKRDFSGSQNQRAYQDRLIGAQFLEFLRKRLVLLRELLSPTGSIFVHLDSKKGHYVKVLMDEVFGEHNFVNEVVWHYRKWSTNTKAYQKNHDTIYWYARQQNHPYRPFESPAFEPPSAGTLKRWKGKKQRAEFDSEGTRSATMTAEESSGAPVSDVWGTIAPVDDLDVLEVSIINPAALERRAVDYPTQEPEALLDRIIRSVTREGDVVLDAFAGSGTTCAVAEKLGRRWVGIDSGKLAIYTTQKRLLNLRKQIGNKGAALQPSPFKVYNAGLYDFSRLRALPWQDWRFFALELFGCRDEPHSVGGLAVDGKLKGSSVLVFNHLEQPGQRIDENTIREIHAAVGKSVGRRFYVIAPRATFDFQQDYVEMDDTRYYALRIPYSVIREIHARSFTELRQPRDAGHVNDTVDAVGFDFISPPEVDVELTSTDPGEAVLTISGFKSRGRHQGRVTTGGFETLSMVLLDCDYNGEMFSFDEVHYADALSAAEYSISLAKIREGATVLAVLLDIYGNEARIPIVYSESIGVDQ